MDYTSFRDFVTAARSQHVTKADFSSARSIIANAASPDLPEEGVAPAIFPGHHLYVKLDLRPGLTTSSNNSDRLKSISLLGDLTQGVRAIVGLFEGALLEAQGPVVHAFIPDEDGNSDAPAVAANAIHAFIERRIRPRAGTDFEKAVVAFCHGPTIFVASVDQHGDNSIVSLAPAANEPAKVLWRHSDKHSSGDILRVETDGRYTVVLEEAVANFAANRQREEVINASLALPELQKEARELSVPVVGAPGSPTVDEPHESFSISVRADIDGFTSRVERAFREGRASMITLANEFHAVMVHARAFGAEANAIHLPWAGDCFNLLLAVDDREEYQKKRKRRVLEILTEFQDHMGKAFPALKWSYSCAAGELENAQKCNTLISRITVGRTTLLLATGLPVERSLRGLAQKGPSAGHGVLWKGDVAQLDSDLQEIMKPCHGGENYRDFEVADVQKARLKTFFIPPKPAYVPHASTPKVSIAVPAVRPFFRID
jgi:hypothetical protein